MRTFLTYLICVAHNGSTHGQLRSWFLCNFSKSQLVRYGPLYQFWARDLRGIRWEVLASYAIDDVRTLQSLILWNEEACART